MGEENVSYVGNNNDGVGGLMYISPEHEEMVRARRLATSRRICSASDDDDDDDDDRGSRMKGRFSKDEKRILFQLIREDPEIFRSFLHQLKRRIWDGKSWMWAIAEKFNKLSKQKRSHDAVRHHLKLRRPSHKSDGSSLSNFTINGRSQDDDDLINLLEHTANCSRRDACTRCLQLHRLRVKKGYAKCGYDGCDKCDESLPFVLDTFDPHALLKRIIAETKTRRKSVQMQHQQQQRDTMMESSKQQQQQQQQRMLPALNIPPPLLHFDFSKIPSPMLSPLHHSPPASPLPTSPLSSPVLDNNNTNNSNNGNNNNNAMNALLAATKDLEEKRRALEEEKRKFAEQRKLHEQTRWLQTLLFPPTPFHHQQQPQTHQKLQSFGLDSPTTDHSHFSLQPFSTIFPSSTKHQHHHAQHHHQQQQQQQQQQHGHHPHFHSSFPPSTPTDQVSVADIHFKQQPAFEGISTISPEIHNKVANDERVNLKRRSFEVDHDLTSFKKPKQHDIADVLQRFPHPQPLH